MIYRKQREIGFLKFFVYMMGITLMGCAIFLAYAVYKRISMPTQVQMFSLAECPSVKDGHMPKVSVDGDIIATEVHGSKITILSKSEGDYALTIVDYCYGTTTTLKPIFSVSTQER